MRDGGAAIAAPDDHTELAERINALGPWFHNMELAGIWTAPDHFLGNYPEDKFRALGEALPDDLANCTVLDIGCNAGFHAIEMKRRGAARVVAIDEDQRYLDQARLACEVTGCEVELRQLSVYDIAALGERFDIVLFMGVLYHLRHPLLALDLIHEHVSRDLLVFQSLQRGSGEIAEPHVDYEFAQEDQFHNPGWPKLHFVEREYAHDWTNWWIPNRACSEAMLRAAGYEIEELVPDDIYLCRHSTAPYAHWQKGAVYPARGSAGEAA